MEELLKIQSELKAPKNQHNNFGNYDYRSAEDILQAVKPLLKENGLTMTISDEVVEVGGRIYVKAKVTVAKDGEVVQTTTAFAREQLDKKGMDEAQITGSASSYARKYALNGMFLIDDVKDPDADEYNNGKNSKNQRNKPKTQSGIDFDEARNRYSRMTKSELRKEYVAVNMSGNYSEKQREALLNMIKKAQETAKDE